MTRPVSARRCPLARLEKTWASSDVDEDLRALGVSLVRQIRRDSPRAPAPVRMAQSLACSVWWRVQLGDGDLLTLNRALGEFTRTFKALGMREPTAGRHRAWPARPGRGDIFSATSVEEEEEME